MNKMSNKTMNKTMNKTSVGPLLAAALGLCIGQQALASCQGSENPAIPEATPTDAFFDYGNGLVLHRPTQLIWTRCAAGQSWTGSDCSGDANLLDWSAALQAAAAHEQAGFDDWRLPNRNELASTIETRCHSPAINGEVFPATPLEWFWTSSPVSGQVDQAWVIPLTDGEVQTAAIAGQYAVRLVRAGRN